MRKRSKLRTIFLMHKFMLILFFYEDCIEDAGNIENDTYTDTDSETGTGMEMQRRNIDGTVIEDHAKAETTQPITPVQPVYVREREYEVKWRENGSEIEDSFLGCMGSGIEAQRISN